MLVWSHHTKVVVQLLPATAHLKGECVELLALIRRILHVWHPALGNGMAFYIACFRRDIRRLLLMGFWRACARARA
jgi:hypothetical protein